MTQVNYYNRDWLVKCRTDINKPADNSVQIILIVQQKNNSLIRVQLFLFYHALRVP